MSEPQEKDLLVQGKEMLELNTLRGDGSIDRDTMARKHKTIKVLVRKLQEDRRENYSHDGAHDPDIQARVVQKIDHLIRDLKNNVSMERHLLKGERRSRSKERKS
jgi:hypothetical protein